MGSSYQKILVTTSSSDPKESFLCFVLTTAHFSFSVQITPTLGELKLPCTLRKIRAAREREGKRKVQPVVIQILVSKWVRYCPLQQAVRKKCQRGSLYTGSHYLSQSAWWCLSLHCLPDKCVLFWPEKLSDGVCLYTNIFEVGKDGFQSFYFYFGHNTAPTFWHIY